MCELLEFENARSAEAAAHYWRCSAAARERGPAGNAVADGTLTLTLTLALTLALTLTLILTLTRHGGVRAARGQEPRDLTLAP